MAGSATSRGEQRPYLYLAARADGRRRLGFRRAVVPASVTLSVPGIELVPAVTLGEALRAAGVDRPLSALVSRRAS